MAYASSNTKRYTPPNQRKSSNRRNSGEGTSSQQSKDGERSQPADTGSQMGNFPQSVITPQDCSRSEAYQLMRERYAAAVLEYNDPTVDLSERPIMYYEGRIWGKLPHQILASANKILPPSISPTDYITEMRQGLLIPRSSSSNS
ncbi:hypothetical protein V5N11_023958 [Cardamine amara subsp. amara]|uniref:Uncharacterized protein n=1 Tax=Cardamine amara subsp. amara TaxID=228776 RepID=A0ABD1B0I1_CARAN